MNKGLAISLVLLLVLIIGGAAAFSTMNKNNDSTSNMAPNQVAQNDPGSVDETGKGAPEARTQPEEANEPADNNDEGEEDEVTITYDGSTYSPSVITISEGIEVEFVNKSDKKMWPASDDHPTHQIYSEFDSKTGIEPGGTYEFEFEKKGAWEFHDHLNPRANGKITVE